MAFNIPNCTVRTEASPTSTSIVDLFDGDASVSGFGNNDVIDLVQKLIILPDAGWEVDMADFGVVGGNFSNGNGNQNIWSGGNINLSIDNIEFQNGADCSGDYGAPTCVEVLFTLDGSFAMNDSNHVLDVCVTGLAIEL